MGRNVPSCPSDASGQTFVELAVHLQNAEAANDNAGVRVMLRNGREEDRAFVLATWTRSYAPRMKGIVRSDIYFKGHPALVDRLLAMGRLVVACSPTNALAIHGWCVGPARSAEPVIHYAYVPPELRRLGLATAMIRRLLGDYRSPIMTSHRWPWPSNRFLFNPYQAGVTA